MNSSQKYPNPVLYGDYSDPDAIRVGEDYYMISSSFTNTPGIPILHSRDLIHWEVIHYVLDNLPDDSYTSVRHGCGVWAPSIRFHNGEFLVFFPMPDEGIYVCRADRITGPWSTPVCIMKGSGYIDPCPFWDDDGNAYLVFALAGSRAGKKSVLMLCRMAGDGLSVSEESRCVYDGNNTENETIEGPKLYKRNGYYYIFAPAGGVKCGHQTVLRSRNIFGPYEYRIVLKQGNTGVNGPHQGAWVDTPSGENYFLHFQDVYAGGRIVHLQPLIWDHDWPVIGTRINSETFGEPAEYVEKPKDADDSFENVKPQTSDDFKNKVLSLQWQWNANHDENWYRFLPEGGMFLKAFPGDSLPLCDLPNLLLQKWPAPEFQCTTVLDFSELMPGECAGIVSLGQTYAGIGLYRSLKNPSDYSIRTITGELHYQTNTSDASQECTQIPVSGEFLKEASYRLTFLYSVKIAEYTDEIDRLDYKGRKQWVKHIPRERITLSLCAPKELTEIPPCTIPAYAGRWVGVKNGIFSFSEKENVPEGGVIIRSVQYE